MRHGERRELNASIRNIPMPDRLRHLPISFEGYPIPWFVPWIDGEPDVRHADTEKWKRAINKDLCWICGQTLGRHKAFVIGPMCAINRTTSEPPSHYDCALYAAKACPFLSRPRMRRNEKDLPDGRIPPPGFALRRNPGACIIWIVRETARSRGYWLARAVAGNEGTMITLGEPVRLEFYAEGRPARRDEIMTSIETGLPELRKLAERDGPDGLTFMQREIDKALRLINTAMEHA